MRFQVIDYLLVLAHIVLGQKSSVQTVPSVSTKGIVSSGSTSTYYGPTSISTSSSSSTIKPSLPGSPISNSSTNSSVPFSTRHPITTPNITTPTMTFSWPPKDTQAGQPSYCIRWHLASAIDTCESILAPILFKHAWNPALGDDCSGLYDSWWYCIDIQAQSSLTLSDDKSTMTIPPMFPLTPTTFPAVNTSFTATPTQAGIAKGCQAFHQAVAGDTYAAIVTLYSFITLEQFYAWNPAVGTQCQNLWVGYWYCVANFGPNDIPAVPVVTAASTSLAPGTVSNCTAWYLSEQGDTCDLISTIFGTFSVNDFIEWNPVVWDDCLGIKPNTYYCIAIPGTPTTRTAPLMTGTISSDNPKQSGIALNCVKFWHVGLTDNCWFIISYAGISESGFFAWNPAVSTPGVGNCKALIPDTYVCIAVQQSPAVTTATS
ncbi:hypothetical protein HYALB_00000300 [Hymenoscyphus albidus]|uniref:LysM domain-containing protein n=1 Tax=Hymenoscyphus albidus TaxID=595503 RepID=A0A9N9LV57_9HELO|nr:hypothetical protein HYALB_00000300 [Hymenoscyphus albidus]